MDFRFWTSFTGLPGKKRKVWVPQIYLATHSKRPFLDICLISYRMIYEEIDWVSWSMLKKLPKEIQNINLFQKKISCWISSIRPKLQMSNKINRKKILENFGLIHNSFYYQMTVYLFHLQLFIHQDLQLFI